MRILALTFILASALPALAETAAGGPRSTPASTTPYAQACRQQLDKLGCRSFESDPDLKDHLLGCDTSDGMSDLSNMVASCLSSTLGVWGELLKINPHDAIMSATSAVSSNLKDQVKPQMAIRQFLLSCMNQQECLINLHKAAHKTPPTEAQIKELSGIKDSWFPAPYTKMQALWSRACGSASFGCASNDPWFNEQLKKILPHKIHQPKENLIKQVNALLAKEYNKFQCMNAAGRTETVCYVVATVIDPLLAAGAIKKFNKMNKLVTAAKGSHKFSAEDLELIGRAEKRLGRKLSEQERAGLIEAHYYADNAIGADGNVTHKGNYTDGQITAKGVKLRKAGFSDDEMRVLMREGFAGADHPVYAKFDTLERGLAPYRGTDPAVDRAIANMDKLQERLLNCPADDLSCLKEIEAILDKTSATWASKLQAQVSPSPIKPAPIAPAATFQRADHVMEHEKLASELSKNSSEIVQRFVREKMKQIDVNLQAAVASRKSNELIKPVFKAKIITGEPYKGLMEIRSLDNGGPRIYAMWDPRIPKVYYLAVGDKSSQAHDMRIAWERWQSIKAAHKMKD